jgi:sarcosine oxidase subunit beta
MPAEILASADVAVVGAGVVGLAAARALAGRGASVVVLERTGISSGQSGIQPGGVRQQWGTAIGCRLARESMRFWADADRLLESPVPLGLRRCGYLFVAHTRETLERLSANVAVQNAEGVPSRMVDPDEAAGLVPGLRTETLAGASWCAEDGYFDRPQSVVEAFARGLDVRLAAVEALRPEGTAWSLATSQGPVAARVVVVAAGIETAALAAPLGITLPIEPEQRHLFLSEPIRERLLEPLVVSAERSFAAKQLGDGRVLASDLAAVGDPVEGTPRWRATIRRVIAELLPALEFVDFSVLASGAYDVTPDRQPVLGPVPGHKGLVVAAGFSGHGFMIAPAVARIVADAVEGRRDDVLDVLDAARFAEDRLVVEPQVV